MTMQDIDFFNFTTMFVYTQLGIGILLLTILLIIIRKKSNIKILLNDIFSRKIISFKRRASRAEYWFIYIICYTSMATFLGIGAWYRVDRDFGISCFAIVCVFIILATIRRLHDLNKSGWWTIIIIPWWQIFVFIDAMSISFIILPTIFSSLSSYAAD